MGWISGLYVIVCGTFELSDAAVERERESQNDSKMKWGWDGMGWGGDYISWWVRVGF